MITILKKRKERKRLYLEAPTVAHAISSVQPFFGGGKKEIVKRPKVYAFDTGFVTYVKGWKDIRDSDHGLLWEHLVLDILRVNFGNVFYWADKEKNEVDFVIKGHGEEVHTVECKINPEKYSPKAVKKFRNYYTDGQNYCFSPHVKTPYKLQIGELEVQFLSTF